MNAKEIMETLVAEEKENIKHAENKEFLRKHQWKVYGAVEALVMAGLLDYEEGNEYKEEIRSYGFDIMVEAKWIG